MQREEGVAEEIDQFCETLQQFITMLYNPQVKEVLDNWVRVCTVLKEYLMNNKRKMYVILKDAKVTNKKTEVIFVRLNTSEELLEESLMFLTAKPIFVEQDLSAVFQQLS